MGNFLAYNVAPAVVVTPLGALGVLFGWISILYYIQGVLHLFKCIWSSGLRNLKIIITTTFDIYVTLILAYQDTFTVNWSDLCDFVFLY